MFELILQKSMKEARREYKSLVRRTKVMPYEYRYTFKKIMNYIYTVGLGIDVGDILLILSGLIELLEDAIAESKGVIEVTGEDIASFCDELMRDAKKHTFSYAGILNDKVRRKVGGKSEDSK